MGSLLLALVIFPFVVAVLACVVPVGVSKLLAPLSGAASFVLALVLIPSVVVHRHVVDGSQLRVDALSVVFLVATTFLYLTASIFSAGYLHLAPDAAGVRYGRRFYAGLNIFCWAMILAPLLSSLALMWAAIEVTTVVSALLVAIDDTDSATEAAWKYILIASMGLGIALFATMALYYAGSSVFGNGVDLSYAKMLTEAHHLPPNVMRLAFGLAVLGYGTKMGLVPVHTWLPDAHSEAPTPVSALLSGALLALCFYVILRFYQITSLAIGSGYPRDVLLGFGVASLLLAALYLLRQRDMKRMFAYSSVEHMGIVAIGMSFGVTLAFVGVLLHVLAHAAAKGTAFFGTGSILRKFGSKDMSVVRGGVGALPLSGPMLVAAVFALSAMPPFGMFRSEFLIVSGGLYEPRYWAAAVLVVLATFAFFGLTWSITRTMLTTGPADAEGSTSPADLETVVAAGTPALSVAGGTPALSVAAGTPALSVAAGTAAASPAASPALSVTVATATIGAQGTHGPRGTDGAEGTHGPRRTRGTEGLDGDGAYEEPATGDGAAAKTITRGEVSPWIVLSMALGIAGLLLLGVHLPADLSRLLNDAARELKSP